MTNIQNIIKLPNKASESERLVYNRSYVGSSYLEDYKQKQKDKLENLVNQHYNLYRQQQFRKKLLTKEQNKMLLNNPSKRFNHEICGLPYSNEGHKIIQYNTGNVGFSKLASCKEIHTCPICARRILKGRSEEILQIAHKHQQQNLKIGFVTLTQSSNNKQTTKELLLQLKSNYRKFQSHLFFKNLKKQNILISQIVATETTYNFKHNGHHHLHILYFYNLETVNEVEEIQKQLIKKWANYTKARLKSQDQKPVKTFNNLNEYITKWDISQEMTNAQSKTSTGKNKGLSYWQLLEFGQLKKRILGLTVKESQQKIKQTCINHIEATKGTRKLTIPKKLRDLYQVEEKTLEQLEQEQNKLEILGLSPQIMWLIILNEIKPKILEICLRNKEHLHIQRKLVYEKLIEYDENIHYKWNHLTDNFQILTNSEY